MQNGPRFFAYSTGILVLGLAVIVFSEKFLVYVNTPGWQGYLALVLYGLVYLNISYGVNRRYILKQVQQSNFAYLLGFLLFLPPAVWVFIKDTGVGASRWLFLVIILFSCMLGAYYGIRSGIKKYNARIAEMKREQQSSKDIPEEMRRPHDKLNRN